MKDSFDEEIQISFTEGMLVDYMVSTIGGIIKQHAMENETDWDDEHEPVGLRMDLMQHVGKAYDQERERRRYWKAIRAIWPNSKLKPKSWRGKTIEFIEKWEHKYYCFIYVMRIKKDQILYKWKKRIRKATVFQK